MEAPDDIAGEMPVAVPRLSVTATQSLQEVAIRELGPSLAPQIFLDLQQDLRLKASLRPFQESKGK